MVHLAVILAVERLNAALLIRDLAFVFDWNLDFGQVADLAKTASRAESLELLVRLRLYWDSLDPVPSSAEH